MIIFSMKGRSNRDFPCVLSISMLPLYATCLLIGCVYGFAKDTADDDETSTDTRAAVDAESDTASSADTSDGSFTLGELTFQNGADGYQSAVDVELRQAYPDIAYPSNQTLRAYLPLDVNEGNEQQALLHFNDIFGDAGGKIPQDSKILRASLLLWGTAPSEGNLFLHRLLRDWGPDADWNDLVAGVSRNDADACAIADSRLSVYYSAGQLYAFDVRESLSAWQTDPVTNYGWQVVSDGADGFEFASSEYATPTLRPRLEVELVWQNAPRVERIAPVGKNALSTSTSPTLAVIATAPGGSLLDVVFYGREKSVEKWTLVALPDTQFYAASTAYNEIFMSQAEWIVSNKEALNIQMVVHEGDIVNDPLSQAQWDVASAALHLLMDNDIPFAPVPGNHDHEGWQREGVTSIYSATFPSSDFETSPWWAEGADLNDNNNNYVTLTIGGEKYLFLGLDFCPLPDEIEWANEVLDVHPNHKAILTTHAYIRDNDGAYTTTSCSDTSYIFDDLVYNRENLQIVLCGHMHLSDGEFYRPDYNASGGLVHQLVADYQSREYGGNGRLRLMTFDPSTDSIHVQTYSPYTGFYETDEDSDFILPYEMKGGEPFLELGAVSDMPSGGTSEIVWKKLKPGATYEWYVIAAGAEQTTVSPVWELTVAE